MPQHEALERAPYDHETDHDPGRLGAGRRRQVDDWGVGEELFDRLPSRRFVRTDGPTRSRRGRVQQGSRASLDAPGHAQADTPREQGGHQAAPHALMRDAAVEFGGAAAAQVGEPAAAKVGEPAAAEVGRPVAARFGGAAAAKLDGSSAATAGGSAPALAGAGSSAAREHPATAWQPPQLDANGRRTVVISGRPGPLGQVPVRRRPPRTAAERIGARPDRIVAWAVALGLLLIVIAVATANAAVVPAAVLPAALHRRSRRIVPLGEHPAPSGRAAGNSRS